MKDSRHGTARTRKRLSVLFIAGALLALAPASAVAEGGGSIAAATPVTPGAQEFGTAIAPQGVNCDGGGFADAYRSWWALKLVAGDRVTIDWQVTPGPTDQEFAEIDVLPAGTNDFNLPNTNFSASTEFPLGQQMGEFVFNAPASGVMPMEFYRGDCATQAGPYSFTAYVAHRLLLSFPHVGSLARKGRVNVGVHMADGTALSGLRVAVQVLGRHGWSTVGSANALGGRANVKVSLPASMRGKREWLRAAAGGPGFFPARSNSVRVRVH
jgi:hypothetical protein